jgi:hypothetical protein
MPGLSTGTTIHLVGVWKAKGVSAFSLIKFSDGVVVQEPPLHLSGLSLWRKEKSPDFLGGEFAAVPDESLFSARAVLGSEVALAIAWNARASVAGVTTELR